MRTVPHRGNLGVFIEVLGHRWEHNYWATIVAAMRTGLRLERTAMYIRRQALEIAAG